MGGLALALQKMGYEVAGCDRTTPYDPMRSALEKANIPYVSTWNTTHIEKFQPDMVIVGNVCTADNPMVSWVITHKIPFEHMAKMVSALATLSGVRTNIVVAGTHGKTTTSFLLRHVCESAGLNTGSFIGGFEAGGRGGVILGSAHDVFVFEGDEYDCAYYDKQPKMMYYGGHLAVLTSCEHDHVDIYPTLDSMVQAYAGWLRTLPPQAQLWVSQTLYQSEVWSNQLASAIRKDTSVRTYGLQTASFSPDVGYRLTDTGELDILMQGEIIGKHPSPKQPHPGYYESVCVAYGVGQALRIAPVKLSAAIDSFPGVKRRFTLLRQDEITVIDDFAHHPTAVAMNLKALRVRYPHRRICAVFEPKSATSRRNILFSQWKVALGEADVALIAPIAQGSALKNTDSLNISEICADIRHRGRMGESAKDMADLQAKIIALARPGDVWIVFSNGDLSTVAQALTTHRF